MSAGDSKLLFLEVSTWLTPLQVPKQTSSVLQGLPRPLRFQLHPSPFAPSLLYFYHFLTLYVSLTSLFIACFFPLEGKLHKGGIFVHLFIAASPLPPGGLGTGNICGMNDRKVEAAQGLSLWAQSQT